LFSIAAADALSCAGSRVTLHIIAA
jgi:hypothetical protein